MSEADRIAAISARASVLLARISKTASNAPKRPHIPGDGDGDGIPYEGKKPGGQPKLGPKGLAYMQRHMEGESMMSRQMGNKLTPEHVKHMESMRSAAMAHAATLDAPKKPMTFIDVLNHPEGKRMVNAIEDTMSSLQGKRGDKILGGVLRAQVQELKDKLGFHHEDAAALAAQHLSHARTKR